MTRENCLTKTAAARWTLTLAFAIPAAFALSETRPATTPAPAADPLSAVLQERISGKKPLDDVRIDVDWPQGATPVTVRVYGDGVGIWELKVQFTLTRDEIVAALKLLRDGRFGAMPGSFGSDMEGEEESPVRLKGRVVLRVGSQVKRVAQLGDGDQSSELAAIAEKLLAICSGPAARGKGATSLAEGLRLVTEKKLSPRVLSVVMRRGAGSGERWVLRVEGRTVTNREIPRSGKPPAPRRLVLSEADFASLLGTLDGAQIESLPSNLYSPVYTDLRVTLLDHSRSVTAREYANVTRETHGAKQQAFDRILEALEALHTKAEKEGAPAQEVVVISESDREREAERKREREEKAEERQKLLTPSARPAPSPSPAAPGF